MDETVKERLVGMGVLLILGVIFIPLVLNGNTTDLEEITNQNLNLPVPSDGISHEMSFSDGNVRRLSLPLPGAEKEKTPAAQVTSENPEKANSKPIPASGFIDELPNTKTASTGSKNSSSSTQTSAQKSSSTSVGEVNRSTPNSGSAIESPKIESNLKSSSTLQNNKVVNSATAWVVQIGSFGDRENAEKEVTSLKAKGFPAFVRRFVSSEDKVLYRVRIGPEKDRARAEKLFERLSKAGIKGQIVADP